MNSMHTRHCYLLVTLLAMSSPTLAADHDANKPNIADRAPDCAWGDATFDDACAGFSAKMAAKIARYVTEHSPKSIASKSANSGATNGTSK